MGSLKTGQQRVFQDLPNLCYFCSLSVAINFQTQISLLLSLFTANSMAHAAKKYTSEMVVSIIAIANDYMLSIDLPQF